MTLSSSPLLVELKNLSFGYGDRVILNDISFGIPRGKVTALMGVSGGGKTTVLRLIGGQYKAQKGKLEFDGHDVGQMNTEQLYAARRRMGMLFQFGALFTDMDVFDNVAFPLKEHTKMSDAMVRDIVLMKLDAVGLRGARNLKPSEISGGMGRRVALARAIALDPDLMMYDEPFVVSHDVNETFQIADHVVILANGKVAAQGTPDSLRQTTDPLIHQFVNGLSDGPVHFHYPAKTVAEDFGRATA